MRITQYVLPVVVGAMGGMILITLGEMAVQTIYPLPIGTDKYDADSLAIAFRTLNNIAFVYFLIAYTICSFLAGLIATLVAMRTSAVPAIVVGIVLSLAGLYKIIYLPHPLWFSIVIMLVYFPFSYLGYMAVRKKLVKDSGVGIVT
jgi:hypothetical protein